ncbi:MAG: hypothetical protein M0Z46_10655 [Actinomycetota bacterium]|nr:hypothetical protein [Actinomycetota bacterium]
MSDLAVSDACNEYAHSLCPGCPCSCHRCNRRFASVVDGYLRNCLLPEGHAGRCAWRRPQEPSE